MRWTEGQVHACSQCSILLKNCVFHVYTYYTILWGTQAAFVILRILHLNSKKYLKSFFSLDLFVSVLSDALKMLFQIRPYSIWCYFCSFCSFEYFSDKFACLITLKFQLLAFTLWIFQLGNIADKAGVLQISWLHCKTLSQYSLDLLFALNEADLMKRVHVLM